MTRRSLDDELKELLVELAESEPVDIPGWSDVVSRRAPTLTDGGRRLLVAAIAAAGLAILAGALVVSRRTTTVTTGPATTGGESVEIPALLSPGSDGPTISTSELRAQQPVEEPRGTVAAPDGTLYVLSLARATDDTIPGELVEVAGFDATVTIDGSAPTQIYRTVDLGCLLLTITTADAPAVSADLTTLLEGMAISGAEISIDLEPGWTSYGVGSAVEQHTSTLQVLLEDGSPQELFLQQSRGAPIGYYLLSETAPVPLATGGSDQLWSWAGATTPGLNIIVGTRFGTSFQLSGQAPVDLLLSVVESLGPVNSASALPPSGEADSTEVFIDPGSPRATEQGCSSSTPTLTIEE